MSCCCGNGGAVPAAPAALLVNWNEHRSCPVVQWLGAPIRHQFATWMNWTAENWKVGRAGSVRLEQRAVGAVGEAAEEETRTEMKRAK